MSEWAITALAFAAGSVDAAIVSVFAIRIAPQRLQRVNVEGRNVPAVLGWAVLSGGVMGLLVLAPWVEKQGLPCDGNLDCQGPDEWLPLKVVGLLLVAMFLVGLWDDLKGDERPRGFGGHLGALRGGAVTGGMVKLVGGALSGLVAMYLLDGDVTLFLFLGGACIALAANLFNLLDRAPGRASKLWLAIAVLVALAEPEWRLWSAGTIGAVAATLPFDLRARGMLGDTGANPMGAVLGLGLVFAAGSEAVLAAIVMILLGLNLASEKVSFSNVIADTPWLARLDHLGRK